MNIVSAVILCTIVGAIGAVVLVLAAKFMAVEDQLMPLNSTKI